MDQKLPELSHINHGVNHIQTAHIRPLVAKRVISPKHVEVRVVIGDRSNNAINQVIQFCDNVSGE